jgi:hypothetical protein
MAISFNTNPYHDNFDESKQFYRILFRPGRAVQARELTQLQTALQNQVARFGQNIFKEGSIVVPGQRNLDIFYSYVKLTETYNSVITDDVIENLVGSTVTGQTSGVKGIVVNVSKTTSFDPPTLFVKYINSGNDSVTYSFADSEIITNEDGSILVQAVATAATGKGTAFSVQPGVIFCRGVFAYFDAQTLLVSKYTDTPSASIGFKITESTVTSDDDESLLDPAVGSYNYFAPGADRYKLALDLEARPLIPTGNESEDFVELARVENGVIILLKKDADYNILADTLARRTYDESGNYVVRPYGLEVIEHLRTSNTSIRDGLYDPNNGGNLDLFVNVIKPGKAYVLGYELENLKTQYIDATKARDFVSVPNGTIAAEVGNFVYITTPYSIPDLAVLSEVDLYSNYTTAAGSASGTKVGTARIRALEHHSGSGASTIYKLYLFDIEMLAGFTFEHDVKQIYYNATGYPDFTANIYPTLFTINGSVTTTDGSNIITGAGTRFTEELHSAVSSYVTINGNIIQISSVVNDVTLYASTNLVGNISGVSLSRHDANIVLPEKGLYLFELPYSTIKSVDSTGVETQYSSRRVYDRTLSTGSVTITAGSDEVFVPYSIDNYICVNKTTGAYVDVSSNITLGGSPTGKTVTVTLGSSYGSNEIRLISTLQKTNTAAAKKVKTLVSGSTIDFTSNVAATASTLSLGRPDIYRVSNVRMSANAFGTAYKSSNSIDVTDRYTLDNGQRRTHYDLGSMVLKSGQPVPTGPVRVHFDYFTHSAGDYFTVQSYSDINYKDIPSFVDSNRTYQLRDCLDFRPVINTDGITYTNPSEFLDPEVYLTTDYEYYLPRTDKIVIDSTGSIKVVQGISSLTPVEPATPQNSMALYVLAQKPYVFDPKKDIDVTVIDNRRFTMRDIGRIENRVKNLEYYTTLSLLEKDTSLYQIKDSLGFDRFKNGFVVDNFTGHGIGNEKDPDYGISMDIDKGELRPLFTQNSYRLKEISSGYTARFANSYVVTGNLATLPYATQVFVESTAASRVENINPFSVVQFVGTIELNPPTDNWFDTTRLPDLYENREGSFNTLVSESVARGTYGTVWNDWQTFWAGSTRVEERTGVNYRVVERIDTTTNNDVVVSKVLIPKMRSINISFNAKGMKPNTRLQVYFDDLRVTEFCTSDPGTGDTANTFLSGFSTYYNNIVTNANGEASGTFYYDASLLNLPTGEKIFRLTDSPTNGNDSETSAEAIFTSTGELRSIRNEIISTRNGYLTSEAVFDRREIAEPPAQPPATETPSVVQIPEITGPAPGPASLRSIDIAVNYNPSISDSYFRIEEVSGVKTSSGTVRVFVPVGGTIRPQAISYPTGGSATISPSSVTLSAGQAYDFSFSVTAPNFNYSQFTYAFGFLADGDPGSYNTFEVAQSVIKGPSTAPAGVTVADLVYGYSFGRTPDAEGAEWWGDRGNWEVVCNIAQTVDPAVSTQLATYVGPNGTLDPWTVKSDLQSGALVPTAEYNQVFDAIHEIVSVGVQNKEDMGPHGAIPYINGAGYSDAEAAWITATQLTIAFLAGSELPSGAIYKDDVLEAIYNPDSFSGTLRSYTISNDLASRTCWGNDPLAQTFIIAGNPLVLTGVDLFFYEKDTSIPMFIEIRKVVNGVPTQTIVPFSRKTVKPEDITLSNDGSEATHIDFDGVVYLEPGEYAVVLLTSSINYRVWISEVGEKDVSTDKVISEQPFIGVLFKSQNASTWTAEQKQDLKFRIYQAVFDTSKVATIDFTIDPDDYQYKALSYLNVNEPLLSYPGSSVLTVNHVDHGFTDGSTVKLTGFPRDKGTYTPVGNVFGINVATLENVEFSVSNVKVDSYTINAGTTSNVTARTFGGGSSIVAMQDVGYDALYPMVSYLEFAGTTVGHRARLTRSGYTLDSGFFNILKDDTTELDTSAILPSSVNIVNNLSGNRPFTFRVTLNTNNQYISPIVDLQQCSVVLAKNKVNNPSYSTLNNALDIVTVASANDISFTKLSAETGLISLVNAGNKANATAIVKGTTVTVSNSSVNSGQFRVLDILNSGGNIKVFGNITTAAAGNVITVTNGTMFVAEEAATGGSALSKYITKKIDFTNPSTSINLRLDVNKPQNANVKIYYKTKLLGEATSIEDKEYVEITGINITDSLSGEFYEIEKQLDSLPQFTSLVVKIVLLASDTAAAPKCKNLRVIALA